MPQVLNGIVRDGRIELVDGPDLIEGQCVRVVIEVPMTDSGPVTAELEGRIHTPLTDPVLIQVLEQVRRERPLLVGRTAGSGRMPTAGRLSLDTTWDDHFREVMETRGISGYREIER